MSRQEHIFKTYMVDSDGQESSHTRSKCICSMEDANTPCSLVRLVPERKVHDAGWHDPRFRHSQEEAGRKQASFVVDCANAHDDGAPEDHDHGEIIFAGELL